MHQLHRGKVTNYCQNHFEALDLGKDYIGSMRILQSIFLESANGESYKH